MVHNIAQFQDFWLPGAENFPIFFTIQISKMTSFSPCGMAGYSPWSAGSIFPTSEVVSRVFSDSFSLVAVTAETKVYGINNNNPNVDQSCSVVVGACMLMLSFQHIAHSRLPGPITP